VMEYNLPACPERLATVARLLREDVEGLEAPQAAETAVEAVQRLKADIGIPMRLRDVGVQEADLRGLAEATVPFTRLLRLNPRPLDADSLEALLRRAW
jgi:alcohol dehydrogenase class IV